MRFSDYISRYVKELEAGTRCKYRHAVPVADKTAEGYKMVGDTIRRFEKETRRMYEIDEVGMEFQRVFAAWCNGRRLKSNTVRQYLILIRTLMNGAVRDRLCTNLEFRMAEFIPLEVESEMLVLSRKMMRELMYKEFKDRRLEKARDVFVVGYLTGQRFSDYSRVCRDMCTEIAGIRYVRLVQRKTNTEVYVPLDDEVDKILIRYGGRLPQMSLTEFNLRLKEVAKEMGWSGLGKLTSHTARRSFATNAYADGVPLSGIMCVTGHTREEHLRKYLRLKSEQMAIQAARDLIG